MKKQFATTLCLVLVLLCTGILTAQEGRGDGRLKGVVYDKDKNPIADAKLTLEYAQFTNKIECSTNDKGQFTFVGLAKGVIKITAVKAGYIDSVIQTDVSGVNKNPTQYITMLKPDEAPKDKADQENDQSKDSFVRANALFSERKFSEALALYSEFRDKQPNLYKIGINIGNCYLEMTRFDEAVQEFQTVIDKLKAENPEVKGNTQIAKLSASIGDAFMRQNKFKEAEQYFKQSIAIDETDHALAYNVAEILYVANKPEEAIQYYNLAIKIKPDWPNPYRQLGYVYLNQGDLNKAKTNFKKFLQLAPNSEDAPGIEEVLKSI